MTMAWCFKDEISKMSIKIFEMVLDEGAIVPPVWWSEFANAILVSLRKGRTLQSDVAQWFALIDSLPLTTDTFSQRISCERTFAVAQKLHLTSYDAAYLELAERLDLPLATLDKKLQHAAQKSGVKLLTGGMDRRI